MAAFAFLIVVGNVPAFERIPRNLGSIFRVAVTSQRYDFFRPWDKRNPSSKEGLGILVRNNRILVTARLVADATYIELEAPATGEKVLGSVEAIDHLADLAVIKPEDSRFMWRLKPWRLQKKAKLDDQLKAIQFEGNGTPIFTDGEIKSIEVAGYPHGESSFLVYRVDISLAQTGSSFTVPFVKRGKLAGVLMEYSRNSRNAVLIPGVVIDHFLTDLEDGHYDGFPRAGFEFSPLEDPQLRRFVGIDDNDSGVYITAVIPGSGADIDGLKPGDVLLAIDQYAIDKYGQYNDKDFGRISLAHLTTTHAFAGNLRNFKILRDGQMSFLTVHMNHISLRDYPSAPFVIDEPPEYFIAGGLVFQELSRQYLKEWGGNWASNAPRRLVYYDRHQWDLFEPGSRIVILSQILPSGSNIGYEDLRYLPVTEVNGVKVRRLKDIPRALSIPIDGFHHIVFAENPKKIYLEATALEAENAVIKERFGLTNLLRFNDN